MDFNDPNHSLDSLIHGNAFSDEFELDPLTYEFDGSQGVSSSSSDRLGGDSSSDSSPPLSCVNTNSSEEMWDFNFQPDSQFPMYDDTSFMQFDDEQQIGTQDLNVPLHYQTNEVPKERSWFTPPAPVQKPQEPKKVVKLFNPLIIKNMPQLAQQQQKKLPPRYQPPTRLVSIAPSNNIQFREAQFSSAQTRKIKNRMYAQASRTRKKEEEFKMKEMLQDLDRENQQLRRENYQLKQRLAMYEEPSQPRQPFLAARSSGPGAKQKFIAAGTALMVFGLFVMITPFSISSVPIATTNSLEVRVAPSNHSSDMIVRPGRTLDASLEVQDSVKKVDKTLIEIPVNTSQFDCQMNKLNASETIRVNKDIDRWVQEHSFDNVPMKFSGGLLNKEAMRKFNMERKVELKNLLAKKPIQKKSETARLRERTWRQLELLETDPTTIDSNNEAKRQNMNVDKIASIIQQKSDTLHIMALQDYILLPANKKGVNQRPKLSLFLPSVPLNGTLLDQYSLIRVDCEITGTGKLTISNKQLLYLMP